MKQKQLILMVVAVGCGLVAAFLTSQLGAKPAVQQQQVEILVAAKELTPGTKFTKDSLKDQVKRRKMNPNDVPQNALSTEEELEGKQLVKTLRADDHIGQSDLGKYEELKPPAGKKLVTLKLPIESLTPFVRPTSRVDLLGTVRTDSGRVKSRILIPTMLIMAVDVVTTPNQGGVQGNPTIQMVTLAADISEAEVIRRSQAANVTISFVLNTDADETAKEWNADEVFQWLNDLHGGTRTAANPEGGGEAPKPDETKVETPKPTPGVKIWVPTEDIPAGTALTSDLFDKKFREVEWKEKVPENVVLNIRESIGKYLVKDVFKEFPIVKTAVGDKPEERKPDPTPVEAPKPKRPTFDQTITGANGSTVYRYEQQENGKWKLLGQLYPDGSVGPVTAPAMPAPNAAPAMPAPAMPAPDAPAPKEPRIT